LKERGESQKAPEGGELWGDGLSRLSHLSGGILRICPVVRLTSSYMQTNQSYAIQPIHIIKINPYSPQIKFYFAHRPTSGAIALAVAG
jgi:hypothetical protein